MKQTKCNNCEIRIVAGDICVMCDKERSGTQPAMQRMPLLGLALVVVKPGKRGEEADDMDKLYRALVPNKKTNAVIYANI